ncbi:MAG: hypothetical protein EZS28_018538 [Streblomastix strix]|uniref:Uncharacterized protein n=1 Tax=Streblomastix strix TaxID=222440 RepID=A0A5J4VTN8_9EUKA|nr:MAG: hypothetical protein EZS28_018538 [Streblomastix strix]
MVNQIKQLLQENADIRREKDEIESKLREKMQNLESKLQVEQEQKEEIFENLHQVQQEKEKEIIEKEILKQEIIKLKEEIVKLKEKEKMKIQTSIYYKDNIAIIPSEFNIIDGIVGLGPDILLEILNEIRILRDFQQVICSCKKIYNLQNHPRFQSIKEQFKYLPIAIHNIDSTRFDFVDIDGIKKKIIKKQNGWNGISLSGVLNDGIYSIEVEFKETRVNDGALGIVRDSYDIPYGEDISISPRIDNIAVFGGSSWYNKVWHKDSRIIGNSPIQEGQIIKLEYDSNKRTLICFIDGVQQPVYINGINEKVRFLISTYYTESTITIHSFKRLSETTSGHISGEIAVQW